MTEKEIRSPLVHFEVVSAEPERSRKFYEKVFKWEFPKEPLKGTKGLPEGYNLVGSVTRAIQTDGYVVGTLSKISNNAKRPMLNAFFLVDNVTETLKEVDQAGGNVTFPRTELPIGFIAVFKDPDGIEIGILEVTGEDRIRRVKQALSKGLSPIGGLMYSTDLDIMTRKE